MSEKWAEIEAQVSFNEIIDRKCTVTDRYRTRLVKATKTELGYEDHGMLWAKIDIQMGSSSLTSICPIVGSEFLAPYVEKLIQTIGGPYGSWERITGAMFYALWDQGPGIDHGMDVRGIMSLDEKRWFLFSEVFQKAEAN